jgi:hypothetical protein
LRANIDIDLRDDPRRLSVMRQGELALAVRTLHRATAEGIWFIRNRSAALGTFKSFHKLYDKLLACRVIKQSAKPTNDSSAAL